jgi:methyl-accepting chemotaxis protein
MLTRWLAFAAAFSAAVLVVLGGVAVASYVAAGNSADASLHAALAQRHLQAYLRGVNEVLLTEGSSSARNVVKLSGVAFAAEIASLMGHVDTAQDRLALADHALPTWKQVSSAVDALLARKGVSASDDASMLAYGKISGQAESLIEVMSGIESRAEPAEREAARRMQGLIGAAVVVAVLFVIAVGRLVMQLMFDRLGGSPEQVRAIAMQIAAHDLTAQIPESGSGQRATLLDALRDIRNKLGTVVSHVHDNANGLAVSAAQIAQGNLDLSNRTEQQASALEQTAASMEQLGSTVRQNAENARQANQLAQSASTVAARGGEVVGQVVETMKGINDSSSKIADIIGVIDGIAFQTNILALNAAVEAARAGEQGRGFAVVAAEVRSLARRSAEAAKEIKGLITVSVERVGHGGVLVDRAGATMHEVVASIKRVTDIMGEISSASAEQSAGLSQVSAAVGQMDRATQQNAALVEESAAAAESLKQQAQQLVHAVAVFKLS